MLHRLPITEESYKKLKEIISNIFYEHEKEFDKQAQKLADELFELSWGQTRLLAAALNIIFTKFKETKKEK
ncbi:unnamed protein product [marine sediment metagenome]|uniref:Uncharacterized protein n=1 Tax=marine sediment metagenome TaxID=412755 RepID=X1HTD1_9ZZZZ